MRVTNSGNYDGSPPPLFDADGKSAKHTVLFYLSDEYRTITPEVKMLKHFEKVELATGESQVVTWAISEADLSFYGKDLYVSLPFIK